MLKRPILLPLLVLIISIIAIDICLPPFFIRDHYVKHLNESLHFKYLILDDGKETPKNYGYNAKVIAYYDYENRIWKSTRGKIKLYIPKRGLPNGGLFPTNNFTKNDSVDNPRFHYGDVLVSSDKLLPIVNFDSSFNYERYMKHQRIYHQVFVHSFRIIETNKGNFFVRIAKKTNYALQNRILYSGMKDDQAHLAIAMLLGDKHELNPEVRSWFNVSGLAHILCVSGLHIMMIVLYISFLLKILLPKTIQGVYIRNFISILSCWIIAFIVGLTPSALRVATMLTLLIITKFTPFSNDKLNILLVTAFVFLCIEPMLLFNISFQLSFLAVLGIILTQRFFNNFLIYITKTKNKYLKAVFSNVATTTSAQLLTFPIIVINFHRFPIFAILTNLLVVPCMQVILISLIVLLILVDIPLIGDVIAWICNTEMTILMAIAKGTDYLTMLF